MHHIVGDPSRWKQRVQAAFKKLIVQVHAAAACGVRAADRGEGQACEGAAVLDDDISEANVPQVFSVVCPECGLRFRNRRLAGHHRRYVHGVLPDSGCL